jgi:hypothetical protein
MRKIIPAILFVLYTLSFFAQDQESFKKQFTEANTLMEENFYDKALPIWLSLLKENPDNFNLNYKVGLCYLHSSNHKKDALPYLIKASQGTTTNYDPFSFNEKQAPLETIYYLAKAYHINYDLDKAMMNYMSFKDKITKKHYLYEEVDHDIEMCKNAKIALKNPVNIEVKNLGQKINSIYPEYSPVINIGEDIIYFTSRRLRPDSSNLYIKDVDGMFFEDIYASEKENGEWNEPQLLPFNTAGHEATVNLSVDGRTLFVYKDDNGDGNLYMTKLDEDDIWGPLTKLPDNINSEYQETHVAITPDERTLYFISNRKGGFGGKDIYQAKLLPTGEWAKPQNVGPVLNTKWDEDGIFIHPDGKTLYFSSRGHNSIGGYDIFYSKMDSTGNWSKPVNMGYPVNSTDDDVFFVTSTDGKRGYYSSFKEDGYGEKDIYVISLIDKEEVPLTLLVGYIQVEGYETMPDNAEIRVTNNETGELVGIYKPRKKNGKFSIILPPGGDYHVEYKAAEFKEEEDIYVPEMAAYQQLNREIELRTVKFGTGKETNDLANNNTSSNNTSNNTSDSNTGTNNNTNTTNKPKDVSTSSNLAENLNKIKAQLQKAKIQAEFKQNFTYNQNKIDVSSAYFTKLMDAIAAKVNAGEYVLLEFEASASKVPTRTYGSNTILAKKRGQTAIDVVKEELNKRGIDISKVIFDTPKSLVQGPEYAGDFQHQEKYEKFQYIVITAK